MSLASANNRNDYVGNAATSSYSYTFKIFDDDDLLVTVRDTDGLETTLVKTTDYTVSGVGETGGGAIALVSSGQSWLTAGNLKNGYALTIRRVRALTQVTDLRNQGSAFREVLENAFDNSAMVDQQQQDEIDRSLKLPETIDPADFDMTWPADITTNGASKVPLLNATSDGFEDADNWPTGNDIINAQTYANNASTSATNSATSATTSANHSTTAQRWATRTTGTVVDVVSGIDSLEYSAKEYATGTIRRGQANGGSAKDWATYTGGTVDDTGYSAKYWAEDAAATAAAFTSNLATHEADTTNVHGITDTADLCRRSATETFTGAKTFDLSVTIKEVSTPANPASTYRRLYFKSDGLLYQLDSSGSETPIGSGGGGVVVVWDELGQAPIKTIENNRSVYLFEAGLSQNLFTDFKVPSSYVVGKPIRLLIKAYSPDTTGNILLRAQSTLLRNDTDDVASTTNQRTTTNAAITMSASNDNEDLVITLDLTATDGTINGVAVGKNDSISVRLYRDTDTATSEIRFLSKQTEVTTT